ncbi:MAG: TusE/DsrC/DsvC family sulfur relay protein [Gammaproteobacteria bacterium]|nr:TusE/DsrC/DsvC family sulfur relay protein [Gammaproteobacteria bacterium]
MIDEAKRTSELAEAAHSMDKSVDTDIDSQNRSYRVKLLSEWSEQQARTIAGEQGIQLTDEHLQVVNALREHYREHGNSHSGRELSDMLDHAFANLGGKKYLRRLFPDGPVRQGMLIAGLPVPAHTEDAGFGTAR